MPDFTEARPSAYLVSHANTGDTYGTVGGLLTGAAAAVKAAAGTMRKTYRENRTPDYLALLHVADLADQAAYFIRNAVWAATDPDNR